VLGELFLGSLGIRLPPLQLAGGIVFFLFGVQTVFGRGATSPVPTPERGHGIAIFPLAVPPIASPAAILAAVALSDNRRFSLAEQAVSTALLLAVLGLTLILLLQASRIHAWIGNAGANLLVRILGLVFAALATEMVLDAVEELLFSIRAA